MQVSNKLLGIAASLHVALGRKLAGRARTVGVLTRRLTMPRPVGGSSRGDVPGWVLITLMSAVLVAGLLAIAGPALQQLFNQAMEQVQP